MSSSLNSFQTAQDLHCANLMQEKTCLSAELQTLNKKCECLVEEIQELIHKNQLQRTLNSKFEIENIELREELRLKQNQIEELKRKCLM